MKVGLVAALLSGMPLVSAQDSVPVQFENLEVARAWAQSHAFGGVTERTLDYHGRRIVVLFLGHTSGIFSSEPFVLASQSKSWRVVFHADTYRENMDVSIVGDDLVFWRLGQSTDSQRRVEAARLSLAMLRSD